MTEVGPQRGSKRRKKGEEGVGFSVLCSLFSVLDAAGALFFSKGMESKGMTEVGD